MADKRVNYGRFFHDWLAASAYVRGADQTAKVVSKKKHRSKRNPTASGSDRTGSDKEQKVRILLKLSNRHFRRCMNERLLHELAPILNLQDTGTDSAGSPWGEKLAPTPFERVSSVDVGGFADDAAVWEPFRNNVDMDAEAKALLQMSKQQRNKDSEMARSNAALNAWRSIGHQSRDVLRRSSSWHLFEVFEEKLVAFLRDSQNGVPNLLILQVDDGYLRMLLHATCEFYGLSTRTVPFLVVMDSGGERRQMNWVLVRRGAISKLEAVWSEGQVSLVQFLAGMKGVVRSKAAAA